jgi:hypothetical protein
VSVAHGAADPLEDKTAYVFLPEGVLILAQDKRSAVLGNRQNRPHSPVGTVRNPYTKHRIPATAFAGTIVYLNKIDIHPVKNPRRWVLSVEMVICV